MICCCEHHLVIHNPPAAKGEPSGQCQHPDCLAKGSDGCGLFEVDPVATMRNEQVIVSRVPQACGCVMVTFRDGRKGASQCAAHCFASLRECVATAIRALSEALPQLGRLAEIEDEKAKEKLRKENERLLQIPPPGSRRG